MSATIIYLVTQQAIAAEQAQAQPTKTAAIARKRVDGFGSRFARFEILIERIRAAGGEVRWGSVRDGLLSSVYRDLHATGPADLVDALINFR